MVYLGVLGDFFINSAIINGKDWMDGRISADRYQPEMQDLRITWDAFSNNTPLEVSVTNRDAAAADFLAVLDCTAVRGSLIDGYKGV